MKYLYTLILLLSFTISANAQLYVHADVPTGTTITEMRMVGPWWGGWDPNQGPVATDNGDGTFTFTFDPAPGDTMEFKLYANGAQENFISDAANGNCTTAINSGNIDTDYNSWGNRYWKTTDQLNMYITFGNCSDLTLKTPDNLIKSVHLYPNPTSDFVRISAGESIDLVQVFDVTGRVVKESIPEKSDFSLNVSNLSKGVYLVKLNSGDKEATTKLIK